MTQITATTKEAYKLIHKGALAFGRAERQGFRIDVEYCEKKKEHLSRKIVHLQKKLEETKLIKTWKESIKGQINTDSNHQLAHVLYNVMKITPPKTTKGGQGATDEDALTQINLPGIQLILQIRKLRKMRDTYLDAFLREQTGGYIHPFFNLHTVRTYRSSSDRPNFQNIPKRDKEAMQICRKALFPREGHQLLAIDFSGIEVRIACCYTEDPKLIYDTIHGDMHRDMAMELYKLDSLDKSHPGEKNLRQGGKNGWVFPQFYGDYYGNCAPNLLGWAKVGYLKDDTPTLVHLKDKGLVTLDKHGHLKKWDKFLEHCKKVEDDFWNVRYRVYTKWKQQVWNEYQKTGRVQFKTGFTYKGVARKNELLNAPIQGSAFHCLLWSFIRVDQISQEENWDTALCAQIHDEMITDTLPDELKQVAGTVQRVTCQELPKEWPWIIVPLEVEADLCAIDASWADREGYELPPLKEKK